MQSKTESHIVTDKQGNIFYSGSSKIDALESLHENPYTTLESYEPDKPKPTSSTFTRDNIYDGLTRSVHNAIAYSSNVLTKLDLVELEQIQSRLDRAFSAVEESKAYG
jgi:hypothetical protein